MEASGSRNAYLFWFGCLPARFAIAATALLTGCWRTSLLPVVGLYAAATSAGFLTNVVRTVVGTKERGGFGGVVWWARARVVHMAAWALAAYAAFASTLPWSAGTVLLVDAFLGALFGVLHFTLGWRL